MSWDGPLPLGDLAIILLAVAIVELFRTLLRRRLRPVDQRGGGEGGALAVRGPQREGDSRRARSLAHSWPQERRPQDRGRKQWLADMRAALAARAAEEQAGEPEAAAPAAPPARWAAPEPSPSAPECHSPRQALQPHRSNVPIPRQPGDALLVESRQATRRTLDERRAMRVGGKLQSPVDPHDADSLRAIRVETDDVLARDPVRRRRNRFDRPAD
jgi:hypothetical protein